MATNSQTTKICIEQQQLFISIESWILFYFLVNSGSNALTENKIKYKEILIAKQRSLVNLLH